MDHIYKKLRELEKEIEATKSQFSLGKASLDFSKRKVTRLEKDLSHLVGKLPEQEREVYLLRKRFGKQF